MIAKRRKRNRKWLKWVFFLILVVVAGVVCFLVYDAYFKEPEPKPTGAEDAPAVEVEAGETEKEEEKPVQEETPVVKNEEVVQYEGENPNMAAGLTGIVTYAEVLDGVLRIRVNIDQFVASGNCELMLIRDELSIYNMSVPIAQSAATATCQGFDVPVSGLGSGKVFIQVNLNAEGKTGVITGEATL